MSDNQKGRQESTTKTVKGIFKKDDLDDSLSTSDWGVMLDDNTKKSRKKLQNVKLKEEPLHLVCEWSSCGVLYNDYNKFADHILSHLHCDELDDTFECLWSGCKYTCPTSLLLRQHLCYHGYHNKLMNLGRNLEIRDKLPQCRQDEKYRFPQVESYECNWEYCNEKRTTIDEFLAHIEWHIFHTPASAAEGIINCSWKGCTNKGQFKKRCKLRDHVRIHSKEKAIACPTCGSVFANRTKFNDHRQRQIPLKDQSYLCSQCSKYFPTERLLRDHMRLHINHYKCSMCEMTCPKPTTLAKHIRYRHMQEKPYKCQHCDYTCVSKHNLDVHLKTHTETNAFKCSLCNFEARSAFSLKRHAERSHGKRKFVYECHTCPRRFSRGNYLTRHLMKAHNYHWPAGHSRFRFKLEQKGVYRLQTVRYETLDVTEAIIKDNKKQRRMKKDNQNFKLIQREKNDVNSVESYEVVVDNPGVDNGGKKVLITIDDLDSKGNVLKSRTIQSKEINGGEVKPENVYVFRDVEC